MDIREMEAIDQKAIEKALETIHDTLVKYSAVEMRDRTKGTPEKPGKARKHYVASLYSSRTDAKLLGKPIARLNVNVNFTGWLKGNRTPATAEVADADLLNKWLTE